MWLPEMKHPWCSVLQMICNWSSSHHGDRTPFEIISSALQLGMFGSRNPLLAAALYEDRSYRKCKFMWFRINWEMFSPRGGACYIYVFIISSSMVSANDQRLCRSKISVLHNWQCRKSVNSLFVFLCILISLFLGIITFIHYVDPLYSLYRLSKHVLLVDVVSYNHCSISSVYTNNMSYCFW